jgi:DNA polymerase-3 subunit gamma/tau
MAQALYRKWRPQTFDEIVGQEHVTQTLRNALASGRIGHAYLFAGPRGTGKTTMARLVAKAVNCLAPEPADRPCNQCAICQAVSEGRLIDLIEIDAASHTGVDDVRELRDKIAFRPNECRYKVYIIDEVHRFSGSAFDALLKTIEEPPEHAIFVLATTEIHKVPATILSRCQRFDFRRIPLAQIVDRLQNLVEAEGVRAEREALTLIARSATGSLRDAESLLDQLAATGKEGQISLRQVQATLGTIDADLIMRLVDCVAARDIGGGLALINQALDRGADLRQFTRQIVDHLRSMLLVKLQSETSLDVGAEALQRLQAQAERMTTRGLTQAIKRFNEAEMELKGGWQPQLPLELAIVDVMAVGGGENPVAASPPARVVTVQEVPAAYSVTTETPGEAPGDTQKEARQEVPEREPEHQAGQEKSEPAAQEAENAEPASEPAVEAKIVASELDDQLLQERWAQVLSEMKVRDRAVQALLNSTRPGGVRENTVILVVDHEFARGKLNQDRSKRMVEDVLAYVFGQHCLVEYRLKSASSAGASQEVSAKGDRPRASGDDWSDDPVVEMAKSLGAEIKLISERNKT